MDARVFVLVFFFHVCLCLGEQKSADCLALSLCVVVIVVTLFCFAAAFLFYFLTIKTTIKFFSAKIYVRTIFFGHSFYLCCWSCWPQKSLLILILISVECIETTRCEVNFY